MNDSSPAAGSTHIVTYTAQSQLANPAQLLRGMWADVSASGPLAWRLAVRNIRGQYRRSLLGYIWAVLPVITTTAIWVSLNASGMLSVRGTGIPYPAFVLVNITLWQGFIDSLFSPIHQMETARSMLTKVNFPRESLILAGLLEVTFSFAIRFALVIVGLLWFGVSLPWTIVLAPFAIAMLVLLGTTLGLALLPISLLYEDVNRALIIACSLWLFVTPVVFPPPTRWPWVLITYVNPVTPLLVTARQLLTTGAVTQPLAFGVVAVLLIPCFAGAWLLYRLAIPHMIARISS